MADQLVVRMAYTALAASAAGAALHALFGPVIGVPGLAAGAAVGEGVACVYTYGNERASTAIVAAAGGTGAVLLGNGASFLGGAAAAALGRVALERAFSTTSRTEEQHERAS